MRVVLVGEMSGTRDGLDWPSRGSVLELPDDEAAVLVRGGMARAVAEDSPVLAVVETAVPAVAVERAVVPAAVPSFVGRGSFAGPPVEATPAEAVVAPPLYVPVKRGPGRPPKVAG